MVAGAAVLAVAVTHASVHEPVAVWLLVALVFVGEMVPIRFPFRGETQEVTVSTTFVFALVLLGSPEWAILSQAAASALADFVRRGAWWKNAFNCTQYAIAVGCAGLVFAALSERSYASPAAITPSSLLAVGAAGVTLHVLNLLFIGVAIALSQRVPVSSVVRNDMLFAAAAAVVLLSQAPLVVLAVDHGEWLLPLFGPAVLIAHRNGRVSVQRDHDALHDGLTGLANRTAFEQHVVRMRAQGVDVAVLLADLDHFREVNDTLGHAMGDRLLVQAGERLATRVDGTEGLVARFGGDEFAVVVPVSEDRDVHALSLLVAAPFQAPFDLDGMPFHLDATVGCVLSTDHPDTPDGMLRRAEVAMFVAKERRSGFEMYSAAIDRYDPRRLVLLSDLSKAVERRELMVVYQPKATLDGGTVIGAEALVRWEHPNFGIVGPDEFIPLAEATGLIDNLTKYVLEEAIAQCARWREEGLDLSVAVNVSPRNLHDVGLVAHVESTLARHDVPYSALEIEITETGAMHDPGLAQTVLGILRRRGVSISLDDFGTGHSSLAHLRRLPVDSVKIDRSFVAEMLTSEDDAAIVASTVSLAHALGLTVVAEGVESEAVWHALEQQRCDFGQGYYLSRPLTPTMFTTWLDAARQPVRTLPGRARRLLRS